jgi:uncharacterized caspase-like protein
MALDDLRKQCNKADNPLRTSLLSGHGARDATAATICIPHDGERNNLFSTALWSKTFDNALRELRTNRLVLFVDACHAGAIGAGGHQRRVAAVRSARIW